MTARTVLQPADITRALTRISHEILESNHGGADLIILGIPTRGVALAKRIGAILDSIEPGSGVVGALDVTRIMLAPLATAPDHSTSSVFSTRSPEHELSNPGQSPGSLLVITTDGALAGKPKAARKAATSVGLILLVPAIAMFCPVPSIAVLAFQSGRRL